MEKILTISATLRSEQVYTAKKVDQSENSIELAIYVKNLCKLSSHMNYITFECDEYGVVEDHSSKGWQKKFSLKKKERAVKISVPKKYVMANIIPGYK